MSVNQIDIAGSEDAVQNISEINLGYIDIRELDVGKTFQFNISVPSGFKNISNVTQVTVTFTDTNWSSKLLDVTDIRQSNIFGVYHYSAKFQHPKRKDCGRPIGNWNINAK